MLTKEQQETRTMIEQAIRPLLHRLDHLEKEVRRLKSDLQNTKSKVDRLRR